MHYVNQATFYSLYIALIIGFMVFDFVIGNWILGIIMVLFASWGVWGLVANHKEAKRVGLMTRSQHRLEQYYEAELHSVWESK